MPKPKEKGFGLVETIMAVLVVVLLGAVVYFYIQASQKNDSANTTLPSTTPAASPSTKDALDSNAVTTTVTAFYEKYLAAFKHTIDPTYSGKDPDAAGMKAAVEQYGTVNFISFYDNFNYQYDPVLCAQIYPTSGPTVNEVKISGDKATVTVTQDFNLPNMPPDPKTLTVAVIEQNGLKIDSITCPSFQ